MWNHFANADENEDVSRIVVGTSKAEFLAFNEVLDEERKQIDNHKIPLASVMNGIRFMNVHKNKRPRPSSMAGAFAHSL